MSPVTISSKYVEMKSSLGLLSILLMYFKIKEALFIFLLIDVLTELLIILSTELVTYLIDLLTGLVSGLVTDLIDLLTGLVSGLVTDLIDLLTSLVSGLIDLLTDLVIGFVIDFVTVSFVELPLKELLDLLITCLR